MGGLVSCVYGRPDARKKKKKVVPQPVAKEAETPTETPALDDELQPGITVGNNCDAQC